MPSTNVLNEFCVKIILLRSIQKKKLTEVCNAVYFRLCIDLMHINPPGTAQGFDGSHHPRYIECPRRVIWVEPFRHLANFLYVLF